jgi:hypothetical protein
MEPRTRTATLFGQTKTERTEQALYSIEVDGADCGIAYKPFGFGKQNFVIDRPGKSYVCNLGDNTVYGRGYIAPDKRAFTVDEIAAKIAELRKDRFGPLPRLPTKVEFDRYCAKYVKDERARKQAEERRWAADKIERERERLAEVERTNDVLAGLRSIDDRLSSQLTNLELNGLRVAIDRVASDLARLTPPTYPED